MWFHWNHSILFWNQAWFQKPIRCFCWFHYGFIETILVSKRYFGPNMAKNEVSPQMICSVWNRDTRKCDGTCNLLNICSNTRYRRVTDRHPTSHIQHHSDWEWARRPYWGLTTLEGANVTFPAGSSPATTRTACQQWWVTKCPLNNNN